MDADFEREKQEAIEAGRKALNSLYAAKSQLDSAGNWGVVDLLGGSFISGLVKHSKMGNAQGYIEDAKRDLQKFSRELRDVDMSSNLNLDSMDFLTFADFFFDGLVADWLVQDRINGARRQVDNAIHNVERVLNQLENWR